MAVSTTKILDELKDRDFVHHWEWETHSIQLWRRDDRGIDREVSDKYFAFGIDSCFFTANHEAYGSQVEMYFHCVNDEIARTIGFLIEELGGKINWKWGSDSKSFSVRVSKFKAYHWWE